MNPPMRLTPYALFALLTLGFGLLAAWLLQNNFTNPSAILNWASLKAIFDADTLRLENLGFAHPHGPMLILAPLHFIPGLGGVAPFIVSVMVVAFLLTLWNRHLQMAGYRAVPRTVLVMLMALHPALLGGATGGGREAISLVMFYLLYRSCLRMVYSKDMRSFIAVGLMLAIFFYFDVVSLFLFIALLPLLLVLVPPSMREAPLSVYIVIGMPLLIVLGAWIYFNWIFLGEPLAFIDSYQSGFGGARAEAETLPWLRAFGGEFVAPALLSAFYVLLGYPVLLLLMLRSYQEGRPLRISLVLMFHPVIAIGLATLAYYLASPLQLTALIAAGVMAELGHLTCRGRSLRALVGLLLVGLASSWYLAARDDYSHLRPWLAALTSEQLSSHPGDVALGRWLAEHRQATLLDLRSAHHVVIARGDAVGLLLPFTPEYRLAMRSDRPSVAQIAVPDPDTLQRRHDALNERYPQLYEAGMVGYQRVYDEGGWRVYRRAS